jgi:hypothetical protein
LIKAFGFKIVTPWLVLLFSLCGCSGNPDIFVRKDSGQSAIRKVAVFAFRNNTNVIEASDMVTAAFIAGLVENTRFEVEFPGNVKSFLVRERIVIRTGADLNTITLMGKKLGVHAVFVGQVDEYIGAEETVQDVDPVVSIGVRMVDVETGKILFMAQRRRSGSDYITVLDFGKIRTVGELTKRVISETIEAMPWHDSL